MKQLLIMQQEELLPPSVSSWQNNAAEAENKGGIPSARPQVLISGTHAATVNFFLPHTVAHWQVHKNGKRQG